MKNKKTCVFDTNSLISALLIKKSVSRRAFDKALDNYQIILSEETVLEFNDVAAREKFKKYLKEGELEIFEELLHREAKFIEVKETIEICRDQDDNKFLELAVSGKANIIVSGDKDLLVLDPFRSIRIIRPRTFAEKFPPKKESE